MAHTSRILGTMALGLATACAPNNSCEKNVSVTFAPKSDITAMFDETAQPIPVIRSNLTAYGSFIGMESMPRSEYNQLAADIKAASTEGRDITVSGQLGYKGAKQAFLVRSIETPNHYQIAPPCANR